MNEMSSTWVLGLKNPECYPHPVTQIQLIETHISWVLLTGPFAYKIKKPVHYSFVDFSTLEKRRWFCEEEVRLNKRLAPDVYMGIVRLTGSPTTPKIEGQGDPFEFAVKMKQFPEDQGINWILSKGRKVETCILQLADRIASFHEDIEKAGEHTHYGNPDMVWQPMKECLHDLPLNLLTSTTQECLAQIKKWLYQEWQDLFDVFLQRRRAGFVRECHGDLHLGNIVFFKEKVCVFDALEFEPRLRWIDVMSEVAFLVMDLEHHGRQDLAFLFVNRYLELTGDYEGLKVLRLYQVYRALVRAKVSGLRLAQLEENSFEKEKVKVDMENYIQLAHRSLAGRSPVLALMHGVSGSGKTTVSTHIVKAMGAVRLRSDVERKRLFSEQLLPQDICKKNSDLYHPSMTIRTYEHIQDLARTLLQAGFFVVIDAAFLRKDQRVLFRELAKEQVCPCFIVDVCAPTSVLSKRIEKRSREGRDVSDATVEIMKLQKETEDIFTQEELPHVIGVDSTSLPEIKSAVKKLKEMVKI